MTTPEPVAHKWLPLDAVVLHMQTETAVNRDRADFYRKSAAAYVERVRPDLFTGLDDVFAVDFAAHFPREQADDVILGAVLLTARLYARTGSPAGLVGFAEFGPAAVRREDPDIDRLLGLGRYARPVIG